MKNHIDNLDHKTIGKLLGYYFIDSSVGVNHPFLSEKGAMVIQLLRRFIEDEEQKRGLILIQSPPFCDSSFLETSGHLSHYKDLIFESKNFNGSMITFRPVTCPFHFST